MTFTEKLQHAISDTRSVLCVGLDPDQARIPDAVKLVSDDPTEQVYQFCLDIIEASSPYCSAFKPNLAFFEVLGSEGIQVFEAVLDAIPSDKIIVADAKRGDIGNTAVQYRNAFFDTWYCDAVTLSPLMGMETIAPYLDDERKGVYVLTLTSNPGSEDFFRQPFRNEATLSHYIAKELASLDSDSKGHAGMVVGATRLEDLASILKNHPQASLLIPGVGAQGGDIEALSAILKKHEGLPLINVSRGVMYGKDDGKNYLKAIEERASGYQKKLESLASKFY